MKDSSTFSKNFNTFFLEKKKREENLTKEKKAKEQFYDIKNFKVNRNNEFMENDINVIISERDIKNINMKNNEEDIYEVININRKKDKRYDMISNDNNRSNNIPNEGSKNRFDESEKNNNKKENLQNEVKDNIIKNKSILIKPNNDIYDISKLNNFINNEPFKRLQELKLKINNRYLDKCENISNHVIKEYHNIINNYIDDIKRETLLKINSLKENIENMFDRIDNYIHEVISLKNFVNQKESNPKYGYNYKCIISYYEDILLSNIYEKMILTNNFQENNFYTVVENLKRDLTNQMKKKIREKKNIIKEKWTNIKNTFTQINEEMKLFISNFEKKYNESINMINIETEDFEKKLTQNIYFNKIEINNLIHKENENNKLFFSQLLNSFNDYIMKLYNCIYIKYSKCECLFFFHIINQLNKEESCYVFSIISENFIKNLSNDKVLNYFLKRLQDNYQSIYKKRIELHKEDYFSNFFFFCKTYEDFYIYLNTYYEEYIKMYDEIYKQLICYRDIIFFILFNFDQFLLLIKDEEQNKMVHKERKRGVKKNSNYKKEESKINKNVHIVDENHFINIEKPFYNTTIIDSNNNNNIAQVNYQFNHDNNINDNIIINNETLKCEEDNKSICSKEDSLALINKNKITFEKYIENILNYYNIINLRDDYFLLSFFQFIEMLRTHLQLSNINIENKMCENIFMCKKENEELKINYYLHFKQYNENVKNCLKCKDYIELNNLINMNNILVDKLKQIIKNINEKVQYLCDFIATDLKEYSSKFFFSLLKETKIIASQKENQNDQEKKKKKKKKKKKEKENNDTDNNTKIASQNEEIENAKKSNDIHNETQEFILKEDNNKNKENEIKLINQFINGEYIYIYDISNIIQYVYTNYEYNIKLLLKNCKSTNKTSKKNKNKSKVEQNNTNINIQPFCIYHKSLIQNNISYIKNQIISRNIKKKKENISEQKDENIIVDKDSNVFFLLLPQICFDTSISYDNILFNFNNLKESFQPFITNYYEYFKNIFFEYLLKIKTTTEKIKYSNYFEHIDETHLCEIFNKNEIIINQAYNQLKEKFLKNKEIYVISTNKLNKLIQMYNNIINDSVEEQNIQTCINNIEKILSEKIENFDNFYRTYVSLFEKLNETYNNFMKELENMINKLNKEIKKLEKYYEMIVKIDGKNFDKEEIINRIKCSNEFVQSVMKKKQDIDNLYNANVYIFNNKIKIIKSTCTNNKININDEGHKKVSTNNEMINYLSIKEEIKNNILIFYVLIYHIKKDIISYKNVKSNYQTVVQEQEVDVNENKIKNGNKNKIKNDHNNNNNNNNNNLNGNINVLKNNKMNILYTMENKNVKKGTYKKNTNTSYNNNNNDNIIILKDKNVNSHIDNINIENKFKDIQNHIYKINIFQKIKNIYELDIKSNNSIVNNFFFFFKVFQNVDNLLFSQNNNIEEYNDKLITFDMFINKLKYEQKDEGIFKKEENVIEIEERNEENIKKKNNNKKSNHLNNMFDINKNEGNHLFNVKNLKEYNKQKNTYEPKIFECKEDIQTYITSSIINKKYCDIKFFLYICSYIIYYICKVLQIDDYNNIMKEKKENSQHLLYISYDMSYMIYKNHILNEKTPKNNIIQIQNIKINKKSMSSFIYLPNHLYYKIELTNLFQFEKKIIFDLFEQFFSQIISLQMFDENNKNFQKVQNEYINDIFQLAIYLKVLSKKISYFVFFHIYENYEKLSKDRINYLQINFMKTFDQLSEEIKIRDDNPNSITRRKKELKKLFEQYVLNIRIILANLLYSFYEHLYNNFIFFIHILNLLPCNFSLLSNKHNEDNIKDRSKEGTSLIKIEYIDNSINYDLNDIMKKINNVYNNLNVEPTKGKEKSNENYITNYKMHMNINNDILYMTFHYNNSYIVKKLEKKIEKYMTKFYTHVTNILDEKKKEIIKIISNDKKINRKYYE
ncbi:hypothetical protein PFUGPA_00564 [Plasmodium falciparum Palo Alto/Uganda]|uniref:Uncharacterized protein n=2 Tax=Plasmodium falciparum TaxID=5833 RepID=W4J545_PLAFP|nr:hypothetical protein PFUGPA_00564 [Plasmodium falciparum Palo Alto/Uganda]ETW63217.1 hypothetical protein PFMC_00863 [Plasmodium falciparum CAMP/Malaysia]